MSKTASANGRFSLARFAYSPVSGDRKSGMPAEVLMPAPVLPSVSRVIAGWLAVVRYVP